MVDPVSYIILKVENIPLSALEDDRIHHITLDGRPSLVNHFRRVTVFAATLERRPGPD